MGGRERQEGEGEREREREREREAEAGGRRAGELHLSGIAKGLWCNISFINSPLPYMGMTALIVGFLMDKQHSCGCQLVMLLWWLLIIRDSLPLNTMVVLLRNNLACD